MPSNSETPLVRHPPSLVRKRWPLREEPFRCGGLLLLDVLVALLAARATGNLATGFLVLGLLLIASWPLWAPLSFELSSKGIIRGVFFRRRRIAWSEFTHYELHGHGVFLHSASGAGPMGSWNGLFIPSKPPHTELIAVLDYYLRSKGPDPVASTQTLIP